MHELAVWAHQLVEQEVFFGNIEDLYNLMELSSVKEDVMAALDVHALRLQPGNTQWMERLSSFIQRYVCYTLSATLSLLHSLCYTLSALAETCPCSRYHPA